jgi:hypothetical protein
MTMRLHLSPCLLRDEQWLWIICSLLRVTLSLKYHPNYYSSSQTRHECFAASKLLRNNLRILQARLSLFSTEMLNDSSILLQFIAIAVFWRGAAGIAKVLHHSLYSSNKVA